jgi:hypothetical protein
VGGLLSAAPTPTTRTARTSLDYIWTTRSSSGIRHGTKPSFRAIQVGGAIHHIRLPCLLSTAHPRRYAPCHASLPRNSVLVPSLRFPSFWLRPVVIFVVERFIPFHSVSSCYTAFRYLSGVGPLTDSSISFHSFCAQWRSFVFLRVRQPFNVPHGSVRDNSGRETPYSPCESAARDLRIAADQERHSNSSSYAA